MPPKTPWRIERSEALTTLEAMFRVIPHYVNEDAAAGVRATYALKFRGGPSWTATFDDGTLEVADGSLVHADCRLLSDLVGFLLLAYQRVPLWKAAATGKSIAYGRKPWLAFKFADLVATPWIAAAHPSAPAAISERPKRRRARLASGRRTVPNVGAISVNIDPKVPVDSPDHDSGRWVVGRVPATREAQWERFRESGTRVWKATWQRLIAELTENLVATTSQA